MEVTQNATQTQIATAKEERGIPPASQHSPASSALARFLQALGTAIGEAKFNR